MRHQHTDPTVLYNIHTDATIRFEMRISPALSRQLAAESARTGDSKSTIVRRALDVYLRAINQTIKPPAGR